MKNIDTSKMVTVAFKDGDTEEDKAKALELELFLNHHLRERLDEISKKKFSTKEEASAFVNSKGFIEMLRESLFDKCKAFEPQDKD